MSGGRGVTVWLTGLPSAGKTTLARGLADRLAGWGRQVEVLDGDRMRSMFCADLGFSKEDRETNVRRVGFVARLLASHGVIVLVPVIAPYASSRAAVALDHGEHGVDYLEVYVSAPLNVCAARDVKGLYARQAAGRISNLTGVGDPYEAPASAHLVIDTGTRSVDESLGLLQNLLDTHGLL
jgi:adenylylsulfate kinase